jgi:hypothetical protein
VASNIQKNFVFLIILSIIRKTSNFTASTTEDNFDDFKIGRVA